MGGELVFIIGINYFWDEVNLIQLLMEGKQCGIVGMVIFIGEVYIYVIFVMLIVFVDELGMLLIEQFYLLKMVIVIECIGIVLVCSENVLQLQCDILMQLVIGDYLDLQMFYQCVLYQQFDFICLLWLVVLCLEGLFCLFCQFLFEQVEVWLLQVYCSVCQQLQQQFNQQGNFFLLLECSNMFFFLLLDEEGEGFQQKKWLQQWLQVLVDGEESLLLFCGFFVLVRQLQGYLWVLLQVCQVLDLCDILWLIQCISDYQQLGFIKLLFVVSDLVLFNDFMYDIFGCLIELGCKVLWLLLEIFEMLLQENGNVVWVVDWLGFYCNMLYQCIQCIEKLIGYLVSYFQFYFNVLVVLVIWCLL